MRNFSSLRKQATEKFSSSSASSEDPTGQQESKSSTGIFNIPGSSKVTKTFGNIGNKNTASQVPEQSAPLPTSPSNQNTIFSPLNHPYTAPHTSTPSPPLPPGPPDAFSGYPPPTNPTGPPLSSNPSYDTAEDAQRSSQASPPEPGPLYSSGHTLVASPEIPQDLSISPRIGDSPSPRPEMGRKKGSFGYPFSKSKDKNFDAESERSLLTPTTPQGSTKSSKPQFSVKIPKALRGVANLSELEVDFTGGEVSIVSDTKKKQRKEGLCTACSKIGWEQFASPELSPRGQDDEKLTRKLIFLDRILRKKKKDSCHFCTLIFDAIAENDPFSHPAVKDHLPAQLAGMTFKNWADSLNFAQHLPLYKAAYPFGRSRDNVKLQQEGQGEEVVVEGNIDNDEFTGDDAAKIGSAAAVGALNVGIWTDTDLERVRIMATVGTIIPTLTSFMTGLDAKLPVAISLIIHNANSPDAGLINVDVWGYGNGHRAPLARISNFTLRIASGYQYSPDGALSYGNMLHPEYVNVEDDCGRWLDNCSKCHGESCEEPSWWNELEPPSGPHFKLIDVNDIRIVSKDIADLSGDERVKYAALSYVWGATGSQRLNLHVGNLEALRTTLENQDVPIATTIRDAIDVTRRMGLQYLWADSLCIVQRDGKGQDDPEARAQQIQQMDRIFGHATITIVAADGLHADAGLPGISIPTARSQIARVVQPNINVLLAVKYPTTLGKWDTRAWTFQEKLLSKRMLIFNGGYVSFHCRHSVLREDMPATHAGNGPAQIPWVSEIPKESSALIKRAWDESPVLLRSPFFTEYANLLAQYTSREMTDSRDALNAVLGLLKVLQKMTINKKNALHRISRAIDFGDPTDWTLNGLPEKFLDMALLWQPPAAKGVHLTRREHGDLPSWSWTGWEVGKDPEYDAGALEGHAEKPGVRFEEPFWVSSNDDLSLKKVIADASDNKWPAEERLRPLVMWYKCTAPPISHMTQNEPGNPPILVPVNGHGLGLHFSTEDTEHLKTFQTAALRYRTHQGPPQVKPDVPLATHHLICETLTAKFRVRRTKPRKEIFWKRSTKGLVIDSELFIPEAEILDANDIVIGRFIPTDQRKGLSSSLYDFVLLSEAQYWGNEERVDVVGFPLFNVMVVAWDLRREFATRIGVGKALKTAWWAAEPVAQTIILK